MRQFIRDNPTPFIFGAFLLLAIGMFFLMKPNKDRNQFIQDNQTQAIKSNSPVSVPEIIDSTTTPLTSKDEILIKERDSWVLISVQNQPTLQQPQTFRLPVNWTAREDYLAVVLPKTLSQTLLDDRSIIMRPPNPQSREDAIYVVTDTKDSYFKGRCKEVRNGFLCYGGNNPKTKHVFDVLLY
jgi:hypothetical protein